ncbi:hypothetical protein Glove_292g70 [Diversispora epigaea]|uniref:mRNA guanylyltransferase n=1 Tax=Diversispora epigaea TaxID=1348612 RepID=A0A397I173_9GLOM|nr:hypothetical protein Glove_292g70 [Diversispora epigaea]
MNTPRKQIKLENEESPQVALPAIPGETVNEKQSRILKEKISKLLGVDYNVKRVKSFPGAQPISFTKCHIKELLKENYYVCEKSDGIRVLVYLTENNGRQEVYLIDRKNIYRYIEGMVFPDPEDQSKLHKDTLFDGEIVNDVYDDGSVVVRLYAFDCLLDREKNLMQRPLNKRLGYLNKFIIEPHQKWRIKYLEDDDNTKKLPFELLLKRMEFSYELDKELDMLHEKNNRFKHKSDGLIFTSLPAPYVIGTCTTMLKWKPSSENSIDFKLKCYYSSVKPSFPEQRPDKFELHINKGNKGYNYYDELQVPDILWEKWLKQEMVTKQETSERNLNLDGRIVEVCRKEYPDGSKKWEFMRFRDDKRDGNYFTVVTSILQSIDDNLTEDELRSTKDEIKNAWDQRSEVV